MYSVLVLDRDIKKVLLNKEVIVGVFLDIEKAYDLLWKEELETEFFQAGIRGRMLNWIKNDPVSRFKQCRFQRC